MPHSVYIKGSGCVSPQNSHIVDGLFDEIIEYNNELKVVDPGYRDYIDPKLSRRMSRVLKMGVAAARMSLNNAGVQQPEAIITGTGLGCLQDTIKFMDSIVENDERLLNPASFIQSTHNTISGQIALNLGVNNYNSTYVHRAHSFESALMDAMMQVEIDGKDNVLVGASDELTDKSYKIMQRLGYYKEEEISTSAMMKSETSGSLAGEGAAYFVLTPEAGVKNKARVADLSFFTTSEKNNSAVKIEAFLKHNNLDNNSLILIGRSGDAANDKWYDELSRDVFTDFQLATYKQLCGEYHTSSAFATWLAAEIIDRKKIPSKILENPSLKKKDFSNVLVYNCFKQKYHSLILLTAC